MRNRLMICAVLCASLALSACSVKNELPDLSGMGEITVISREEGSGTRDEFENIIGTNGGGTKNIALSTAEISEIISNDKNAVGYTAYSTLVLPESVKAISVNGITPTVEISAAENTPYAEAIILRTAGNCLPQRRIFLRM